MRGLLRVGHYTMGSGRSASEVFAGLEILADLEKLSASFRSPYAGILPRNHFILKKNGLRRLNNPVRVL
jgi:hypothetical protein